jgi:hypothetical protein
MSNIIQFDWSRHWKRKVEPHLDIPLVRASVEIGMEDYDPAWSWEDGPHAIGRGWLNGQRVVKNKLSWYQPWGRCHWISFFACAIGVLNYPELDWDFITGHCHTVPVGSRRGEHRVVMDILNFKRMTAEESIAFAHFVPPNPRESDMEGWPEAFANYIQNVVPKLRKQHVRLLGLGGRSLTGRRKVPLAVPPDERLRGGRQQLHPRHRTAQLE